jgi:hypothetical protein
MRLIFLTQVVAEAWRRDADEDEDEGGKRRNLVFELWWDGREWPRMAWDWVEGGQLYAMILPVCHWRVAQGG